MEESRTTNANPEEHDKNESQRSCCETSAEFPPIPSVHRTFSYLTMGLGILLANFGVLLWMSPGAMMLSLLPLSMAVVLIAGQYIGLSRGFPDLLELANLVLIVLLGLCLLLALAFPPILIVLAITVPTHILNREFNRQLRAAQTAGLKRIHFAKLTLAEILGAFLILALILGPASLVVHSIVGPR